MDWTNQDEILKKRKQAINAGYDAKTVDSFIAQKKNATLAAEAVRSGKLSLADLPQDQRVEVANLLPGGVVDPKKADAYNSTLNFINTLEQHYQGAGGASFGKGPTARLKGTGRELEGKIGLNAQANTFQRQKEGFVATLKDLTGDTGVLTENDAKRLKGLIPDMGSTPEEAKNLFNDMRKQIASKYGGEAKLTTINPTEPKQTGNPVLDMLSSVGGMIAPETKKYLTETGPAMVQQQQGELQRSTNPLEFLLRNAKNTTQMQLGAVPAATEIASNALPFLKGAGVAAGAAKFGIAGALRGGGTSENIDVIERLKRAAEGGVTGATVGGILGKLSGVSAGGRLTPASKLTAARSAAAEGKVVDTSSVIQAGDNYVSKINPGAKTAWEELKPTLEKGASVQEMLDKLTDWGNKAWTTSGAKRVQDAGMLKAYLYGPGREAIATVAPDVAKLTTQIGNRMGVEGLLKKTAVPAAVGAGIGVPISVALYKLLGGGGMGNQ